ncbi:hypothetical protein HPB47_016194 [Ixodes persulcatus]|uniref:Uncharacterized protein n=1 Tax=Ixodes persulcatus TaxID=34615 RepID=A0AC60QRH6_IXOPE|nr:hypothetical protein HPB47_016194 [Ixodes persulcatus]
MKMTKTMSNFLTVTGHGVMCAYRGMKRVCARCGLEGHFGTAYATHLVATGVALSATTPIAAVRRAGGAVVTTLRRTAPCHGATQWLIVPPVLRPVDPVDLQSTLQLLASATPRTTNPAVRSLLTNLSWTRRLQAQSRQPAGDYFVEERPGSAATDTPGVHGGVYRR